MISVWAGLLRENGLGCEPTSPEKETPSTKLDLPLLALLRQALAQGHTSLLESDLIGHLGSRRQDATPAAVWSAIHRLNLRGDIVVRNDTIALPLAARAEETIAHHLHQIGKLWPGITPPQFAKWIAIEGEQLNDEQRAAVSVLSKAPIGILTGDPGTGKTVTVKALAAVLARAGYQIALTAPTGRAAARLAEASGRSTQTLHRLLHNSQRSIE